ncbi:MAG: hypothetical protein NW220_16925 [Leptolyngbyaceae cyanobacterium bins.349]|nr:hypothetical protein [Leptolyngbyaceae cyanobacterium bins.349]
MANWRTMTRLADQMLREKADQQFEPTIFDDFKKWQAETWQPYWKEIKQEHAVLDEEQLKGIRFKCGLKTVQGNYIRLENAHLHEIQNVPVPGKSYCVHPRYLTTHDPAAADPAMVFMLEAMHQFKGDKFVLKHCPEIREELRQLRQWQKTATMVQIIENYSLSHLLYARSPRFRHFIDTYMDLGNYRDRIRGQIQSTAARHLPPFFTLQIVE